MAFIECRQLTRSFTKGENVVTPLADLDLDVATGFLLIAATLVEPARIALAADLIGERLAWGAAINGLLAIDGGAEPGDRDELNFTIRFPSVEPGWLTSTTITATTARFASCSGSARRSKPGA